MTVSMLYDNISSKEMMMWNQYWKVKNVEAEMARNRNKR